MSPVNNLHPCSLLTPTMKKQLFIGVDIGKSELAICILNGEKRTHKLIANTPAAIKRWLKTLDTSIPIYLAMEHTGRYTRTLLNQLDESQVHIYVLNALDVKLKQGIQRGKSDPADALQIATHIKTYYQTKTVWIRPEPQLESMQILLTRRRKLIRSRASERAQLKELATCKDLDIYSDLTECHNQQIRQLTQHITRVESMIKAVIRQSKILKNQLKWLKSIPGVGNVLAWTMMAKTAGFTKIVNPRKLACYAGVVPFQRSSGSSVRTRPRVSGYADKGFKTVLHMAAMSAVQYNQKLKDFYQKKVNLGKPKMSVLNAVRNKLIHICFALVRDQRPYNPHFSP